MRRRVLSSGAIAASILFVILGFWLGENGNGRAYGMSDLPGLLKNAKMIHVKGWLHLPTVAQQRGQEQKQTKIDFEGWYDRKNNRLRQTFCSWDSANIFTRQERVSDGKYHMMLDHTDETATFSKLNDFSRQLLSYRYSGRLTKRLLGRFQDFGGFVVTGKDVINGKTFDVWEGVILEELPSPILYRGKYWLDPHSGHAGRIHTWSKRPDDREWSPRQQFEQIEHDTAAPAGTFDTTPPAHYTLINTKATAQPFKWKYGGIGMDAISYRRDISFLLEDGSIVLAWTSKNRDAETSQDSLFANLKVGGALPKLPVEVYGLKQQRGGKTILYTGYHVAHTRKAGTFYEWSIYVPDQELPTRHQSNYYSILHRFNLDKDEIPGRMVLNVSQALSISATEFDALVRGAMAELSDGGKVPAHVTYENVMQLSRRLRAELAGRPANRER